MVLQVQRMALKGTTRCYDVLHLILPVLQCTTRQYEFLISGTTGYYEVLQVVMRIIMWYYQMSKVQRVFFFFRHSPKDYLLKNHTKFTKNQLR